jgi:CO/xanthine dehydrogenase Mo-binding subunit
MQSSTQRILSALSSLRWPSMRQSACPGVRRIVGVYDIGTLLNEKTGHSQPIGGIVWGVSLALAEATHIDLRYGRAVNNNLAEYHVPVNLDIGEIDVRRSAFPIKSSTQSALAASAKSASPVPAQRLSMLSITPQVSGSAKPRSRRIC